MRTRFPSIKRYNVYPRIIADLEDGGKLVQTAPQAVFFTNVPATMLTRPDAIMLSDGRDVIFQKDPFPHMWERVANKAAAKAIRLGWDQGIVPGKGVGWAAGLQRFR